MGRRRLAVALLVPEPWATEIDGLRRAFGDPRRDRVAPHVTLIPPVNVGDGDLPAVLDAVHDAAAARPGPLDLLLGPGTTFAPATPIVYLAVGGDLDGLERLNRDLLAGSLDRPAQHPFVPHVTVSGEEPPERLASLLAATERWTASVRIDAVHLLEHVTEPERRWVPIADAPLGPRPVVGRGGLELELVAGRVLDPEAAALLRGHDPDRAGHQLVVAARRERQVVGVALGWVRADEAVLVEVAVAAGSRRQGIGRHLLSRFELEAARAGASHASLTVGGDAALAALVEGSGWLRPAGRSGPRVEDGPVAFVRRLHLS